ncbi:ABC transporter ATP-binding protein [Clostridium culturomicium]|uniref:ABC transporter ATP-binding protein n=1 Tax=Clostridium culturomicium TaxID=1499683 RepID=UPI0005908559|nr:ABC transporter ATP-binding protein [Clostridium culturomicium]
MAFIKVENLKYRYPHTKELALNNISFEIEKGEFIGIIGENNAGKSTLCQALMGLVPNFYKGAYGGKVVIDNIEIAKTPIWKLCEKVGMVFQNPFNQLTGAKDNVYEEIAFGLQNLGIEREEIHTRVEHVLRLLGIYEYKDRNPFDLSGGQMQRVAIASILAMKPEVIVLDEPTSQLDPQGSEEVFEAVDSLTKAGITVIMVEHKIEKIAAYSDKVMLLHKGSLIAYDKPEVIFSMENLMDYGVEAPAFTRICKALNLKKVNSEYYPVTLNGADELLKDYKKSDIYNKGDDLNQVQEIIKVKNLDFSYKIGSPILKNINLSFDNRPTAIIGQNGAGKTTFVKLIKGLLKPVGGNIYYGGKDISSQTVAMLAGKVGFVFQNPNDQIFKNKVIDEVMFGPLNIGMDAQVAREKSMEALSCVGLSDFVEENPYDLGLSERKLVAIASVLAMDTEIIILDEPTIAQDFKGREIIKSIVRKLTGDGKLVITIIHDMDFVAEVFERTIVFAEGKVLLDGKTRDVFDDGEVLRRAYLEQPHVTQLCKKLGYKQVYLTVEDFIS